MKVQSRLTMLLAVSLLGGCSVVDKITGNSSDTCKGASAYTAGATMAGTLGAGNCKGPTGTAGQLYSMTLSQQANLQLTVTTTAFTPFVGLYTSAGKIVAENLTGSPLKAFLPAGSYQVLVTRTSDKDGAFTLTSPTSALGGCASSIGSISESEIGVTIRGASFGGTVTATDCGAANAKMHWYRVQLATGDTISTALTVDRVAGLYLVNSTGTTIASKEMTGAGSWSHTYVATADGYFSVHIESRAVNGVNSLPLNYTVAVH